MPHSAAVLAALATDIFTHLTDTLDKAAARAADTEDDFDPTDSDAFDSWVCGDCHC